MSDKLLESLFVSNRVFAKCSIFSGSSRSYFRTVMSSILQVAEMRIVVAVSFLGSGDLLHVVGKCYTVVGAVSDSL